MNAQAPIVVTDAGKWIETKFSQPQKEPRLMVVIPLGKVRETRLQQS